MKRGTQRETRSSIRLDGTHLRQLTPWWLDAGDDPDWSPNGRWILFRSHTSGDSQSNLFKVHPNGTGFRRITHTFGGDDIWGTGSFSPDGKLITASHGPGVGPAGNFDVYIMNVDGSDLRNVTRSVEFDGLPDWGPRT